MTQKINLLKSRGYESQKSSFVTTDLIFYKIVLIIFPG